MVEAHTFSLAYIQTGPDEIEPSDGKACSRCNEDVEWSETIRQRTVLDCRRGLVDSSWHKLHLYNCIEVCRPRGTALEQYNGSNECKTVTRRETESRPRESRRETWTIPDNEGTNRTTRENVQADTSTPRSCKGKSVPKTSDSKRRC